VIDDQDQILEYVEDIILDISPEIEVVSRISWASAEPVLDKNPNFDLIILDVVLPDIDGIQMFQILRDDYDLGDKVIFMTGASLIGVILERPHIRKPFTEREVQNIIMEYCSEEEIDSLVTYAQN